MESEHTAKTLQIALGSYDRKELRVEKNYLQEQSPALECTCFQNGGRARWNSCVRAVSLML